MVYFLKGKQGTQCKRALEESGCRCSLLPCQGLWDTEEPSPLMHSSYNRETLHLALWTLRSSHASVFYVSCGFLVSRLNFVYVGPLSQLSCSCFLILTLVQFVSASGQSLPLPSPK